MKSASGESLPAGAVNTSHHPYKMPPPIVTLLKYDDFPLRKTGTCNAFAATINRHNKNKFCVSSIFFFTCANSFRAKLIENAPQTKCYREKDTY